MLIFSFGRQEVEEINAKEEAEPLRKAPAQAAEELQRSRWDTFIGMAISNIVAAAIIISTAVTLHAGGRTAIGNAADVAEALSPWPVISLSPF